MRNNRSCGECRECCYASVVEFPNGEVKPSLVWCKYLCEKGCSIYNEDTRPEMCSTFLCPWMRGFGEEEDLTTHTTGDSAGEKLEEASAGGDLDAVADAVWDKVIDPSMQVAGSYGAEISNISDNTGTISDESLYSLSTTVNNPISGSANLRFTMVDGIGIDDTYNNCIIAVQDQTDGHIEMRRVADYVGATKEITLDRVLSFDVVNGDIISISKLSYGGATGTGSGGPSLGD
ncbi:MAG: hypothetical protein ACTSSP_01075 [Candidatus Asgardarchaeia archaeon]